MQQQGQIDDLGFCPSFNCYSSDSLASIAATKVSNQLHQEQTSRFHDEDFEFSIVLGDDEEISNSNSNSNSIHDVSVFPLFNRDLLNKGEVDRVPVDDGGDVSTDSLAKLFLNEREREESPSSSSESDESEGETSGVFCVWRAGGSSPLSKCKKSSSTGSGSKRWRIRDLLRRSNSEGKEAPMVLLTHKKVEIPKQKRSSTEVSIVANANKSNSSSPSFHELFYVQQRAKNEGGKRKSYLPYRQGLVGFFSNVNAKGKKSPF